jgi:hypothetical protein
MISVIGLQQLNGQWNMSDQLLQQLDVTKEDVVDKLTFSKVEIFVTLIATK